MFGQDWSLPLDFLLQSMKAMQDIKYFKGLHSEALTECEDDLTQRSVDLVCQRLAAGLLSLLCPKVSKFRGGYTYKFLLIQE